MSREVYEKVTKFSLSIKKKVRYFLTTSWSECFFCENSFFRHVHCVPPSNFLKFISHVFRKTISNHLRTHKHSHTHRIEVEIPKKPEVINENWDVKISLSSSPWPPKKRLFRWEKKELLSITSCLAEIKCNIIAGSTFYWRQSHAIGGSALSSHSPRPLTPSYQNIPDSSAIKGTALQQNILAPTATHRPSLPMQQTTPPKPFTAAPPKNPE